MEWVKGALLETVIGLRAIQKGDEVQCAGCGEAHVIHSWPAEDDAPQVMDGQGGAGGIIHLHEILAWRRPE